MTDRDDTPEQPRCERCKGYGKRTVPKGCMSAALVQCSACGGSGKGPAPPSATPEQGGERGDDRMSTEHLRTLVECLGDSPVGSIGAEMVAMARELLDARHRLAGGSAEGGGEQPSESVPESGEAIADIVAATEVTSHGDGWFTASVRLCNDGNGEGVCVQGDSARNPIDARHALRLKLASLRDALAGRPGLDTPREDGTRPDEPEDRGYVAEPGRDGAEQGPGRDLWERVARLEKWQAAIIVEVVTRKRDADPFDEPPHSVDLEARQRLDEHDVILGDRVTREELVNAGVVRWDEPGPVDRLDEMADLLRALEQRVRAMEEKSK